MFTSIIPILHHPLPFTSFFSCLLRSSHSISLTCFFLVLVGCFSLGQRSIQWRLAIWFFDPTSVYCVLVFGLSFSPYRSNRALLCHFRQNLQDALSFSFLSWLHASGDSVQLCFCLRSAYILCGWLRYIDSISFPYENKTLNYLSVINPRAL